MATTLLDTANKVFRAIGERPAATLNNVQGDRLKDCIQQAALDVEVLHSWDFLTERVIANSWTLNEADLGPYQRLYEVSIGSPATGFKPLQYVPEPVLDRLPIKPYTGTKDLADYYTTVQGAVKFSNYPADVTSQGRIVFYIQKSIVVPVADTDVWTNVPDRYLPLIEKKASYLACIRILDDPQAASYFQQELEQLVQQFRNYERRVPVGKLNMFRGGR